MEDSLKGNIASLKTFWNRQSFHDMCVESVDRCNTRVVIKLDEYLLILTGAKNFKQKVDEFPTSWISSSLEGDSKAAKLCISLELGIVECEFVNLRLIRRSDYAILIPPIDALR